MAPPWPLSNRDFVYQLESKYFGDNNDILVTLSKATSHPSVPDVHKVTRVLDYNHTLVMKSIEGGKKTKFYVMYFEDPKGGFPIAMVKFAAKKGVPLLIGKRRKSICK